MTQLDAEPVSHGPVSTLALVPHSQQRRVTRVHEIDDPHIGLGGMFAVQTASVLLKRALPRNRHGQHQGIERWMVETFTDQFSGSEQYPRRIGWQRFEFRDQCGTPLLRHPPMQDERGRHFAIQGGQDRIQMLGALGQHKHLPALAVCVPDFCGNRRRPLRIAGKVAEHILNARLLRHINPFAQQARATSRSCGAHSGLAAT